MAIDSEKVAASAAARMIRSCAVAAATPSTSPSTLTSPSWPPRIMSRSERPIPPFCASGSCRGCASRASSAIGAYLRSCALAGPGRLGLAAGTTPMHDQVGVADHEFMLVRDVMQHRHHVIALDVKGRSTLVADQVVVIDAFFGQLVVGPVPDARLLDETELFQHLERAIDRRQVESRVLAANLAEDVLGAEVLLALAQRVPDQLALHRQPVTGRVQRFGRRWSVAHQPIVTGVSTSTTGRSPAVAALSSR